MKKYFLAIVGVGAVLIGGAVFYFFKGQPLQPQDKIAQLISQKYNRPVDTIKVEITQNLEDFAKGTLRFTNEGGGSLWLAAKTINGWELAYDGNGIVPCAAIFPYNFPVEMVPSCLDTLHGNLLVNRSVADATYIINGQNVKLTNGKSDQQLPTRPIVIKTAIFESNTIADVNKDGREDSVVILTQQTGGSGTFYYVALALNTPSGYVGTNAILLGDRIAPQNSRWNNGVLEVNYADRKLTDSFTTPPSVGVTKYFKFSNGLLKEISK